MTDRLGTGRLVGDSSDSKSQEAFPMEVRHFCIYHSSETVLFVSPLHVLLDGTETQFLLCFPYTPMLSKEPSLSRSIAFFREQISGSDQRTKVSVNKCSLYAKKQERAPPVSECYSLVNCPTLTICNCSKAPYLALDFFLTYLPINFSTYLCMCV